MKIKVYKSELGEYVEMDVIAQYKYLGKSYGVESLTNGKIYDCVGYDGSMARIVDDSGEDYLYNLNEFELINDNNMIELQEKEDKLYYYLLVQYEDYPSYREYNYISDDTSVEVGDRVLVDMAGSLAIAEVLETGFFNRFDAPFPVEKTKRIIKKVDENFDLIDFEFKDEWDEADTDSIKMNIDGTYFEFGIKNYTNSQSDDINWANIKIQVYNSYFNYYRNSELLACSEIERILEKLELLLDDKLEKKTKLNFYEPDLEIELHPKLNLKETGEYAYIKEGHEIQDIYMELSINLTDRDGAYTGQKYVMIFNREEIEKLVIYLNKAIKYEI